MTSELKNLILDVRDLDRSLAFYHGLLQLPVEAEEAWDGHRVARLTTGRTQILLLQQPLHEQNPEIERSGAIVMSFRVSNLPWIASNVQANDITVLRELQVGVWGERTFLVADPDGYAVLLTEEVGTLH